jgi:hypothetical protein
VGRSSPLVLDNLGISLVELREEMAKTGNTAQAVSNIIERSFAKSGEVLDTFAIKTKRVNTTLENIGTILGKFGIEILDNLFGTLEEGSLGAYLSLKNYNEQQNKLNSGAQKTKSNLDKVFTDAREQAKKLTKVELLELIAQTEKYAKLVEKHPNLNLKLYATEKLKAYNNQLEILNYYTDLNKVSIGDMKLRLEEIETIQSGLTKTSKKYIELEKEKNTIINYLTGSQEKANKVAKDRLTLLNEEIEATRNINYEQLRAIGIAERKLALENKMNDAVRTFTKESIVKGKGTDKFSKTITTPKELTGVEAIGKTALIGKSLSFTGKLIQDLEYGVDSFADSLSSGFASAIMGANSFNEALKNSLNLLGEIALKSVFSTLIGGLSGGGFLGLIGGALGLEKASGSSGIVGGLDKINNSIQAQTFNSMANKQAPVIVINSQIDGVKFTKGTTLPATNKISKGGLNVNNL